MIQDFVILGLRYKEQCNKVIIGNNAVIRAYTVIYADVIAGDDLTTGHFVTIREHAKIGDKVVIGSGVVIDGNVTIGNRVKIQSQAYVPTATTIGSNVFIGPGARLTNDKYPQRMRDSYSPSGPVIEDNVSIGANSVILPGITVKTGSFIAAGSVVTKSVPPWSLVKGNPGEIFPLPEKLSENNRAKKW